MSQKKPNTLSGILNEKPVEEPEEEPEIVCLCGSTKFKREYELEEARLSRDGKIVLSVGFFGHSDDIDFTEEDKRNLDRLHKRKIDFADRIHVINKDGYIGESTRSEIEYAREHGKDITWLEEPSEDF